MAAPAPAVPDDKELGREPGGQQAAGGAPPRDHLPHVDAGPALLPAAQRLGEQPLLAGADGGEPGRQATAPAATSRSPGRRLSRR